MSEIATKRLCKECGNPLSTYNRTDRCFNHPAPLTASVRQAPAPAKQLKKTLEIPVHGFEKPISVSGVGVPPQPKRAVLQCVSKHFNVAKEDIRSHRHSDLLAVPRAILMFLLKEDLGFSPNEIGMFLSRHRSNVENCANKIKRTFGQHAADIAAIKQMSEYPKKEIQTS